MDSTIRKDFFNYKLRFITFLLLFAYAILHVKLTGEYVDVTLEQWYSLNVRLPFGQRILIPALVRLSGQILTFPIDNLFFIAELIIVILFYLALKKLLAYEFSARQSQYLSWLFILLLPLITLVNYRLPEGGESEFYYPYDSASLLFITVGYLLCLRKQWNYLIPWVFLATFNRESSLLLVLLIPILHIQNFKQVIKPTLFCFLGYCVARMFIFLLISPAEGDVFEFFVRGGTHFLDNLKWLVDAENIFIFSFCFAGLPLFWFAFYDYIPPRYRLIKYLAFFYFVGLLLVGNFRESRIFLEFIILLYLPICIAMKNWLLEQPVYEFYLFKNKTMKWIEYVNRYFIMVSLILILIFRNLINQYLVYLLV